MHPKAGKALSDAKQASARGFGDRVTKMRLEIGVPACLVYMLPSDYDSCQAHPYFFDALLRPARDEPKLVSELIADAEELGVPGECSPLLDSARRILPKKFGDTIEEQMRSMPLKRSAPDAINAAQQRASLANACMTASLRAMEEAGIQPEAMLTYNLSQAMFEAMRRVYTSSSDVHTFTPQDLRDNWHGLPQDLNVDTGHRYWLTRGKQRGWLGHDPDLGWWLLPDGVKEAEGLGVSFAGIAIQPPHRG